MGLSGRGIPCGGMAPTRSLRITFSQVSAAAGGLVTSAAWRVKPPVRSFSLWHVTQYLSRRARGVIAGTGLEPDGCCGGGAAITKREATAQPIKNKSLLRIIHSFHTQIQPYYKRMAEHKIPRKRANGQPRTVTSRHADHHFHARTSGQRLAPQIPGVQSSENGMYGIYGFSRFCR